MPRKPTNQLQRIQAHTPGVFTIDDPRVQPCPTTGCWLWMAAVHRVKGYGTITVSRAKLGLKHTSAPVHRVFWEKVNGPVPAGMVLDHICRVRSCCNPDHLRAVTQYENTMMATSESPTAINARKTHCAKCGKEYGPRNRFGSRACIPCHRIYKAEWQREKMADPIYAARQRERRNKKRALKRAMVGVQCQ